MKMRKLTIALLVAAAAVACTKSESSIVEESSMTQPVAED